MARGTIYFWFDHIQIWLNHSSRKGHYGFIPLPNENWVEECDFLPHQEEKKSATFSNLNSYSDTTLALRKWLRNFLCMSLEAKEVRKDCSACARTLMSPNIWSSFCYSLIYRLIQIIVKRGNSEHFMTSCIVRQRISVILALWSRKSFCTCKEPKEDT